MRYAGQRRDDTAMMNTKTNREVAGRTARHAVGVQTAMTRIKGTIGWVLGTGVALYMLLAAAAGVFVR